MKLTSSTCFARRAMKLLPLVAQLPASSTPVRFLASRRGRIGIFSDGLDQQQAPTTTTTTTPSKPNLSSSFLEVDEPPFFIDHLYDHRSVLPSLLSSVSPAMLDIILSPAFPLSASLSPLLPTIEVADETDDHYRFQGKGNQKVTTFFSNREFSLHFQSDLLGLTEAQSNSQSRTAAC